MGRTGENYLLAGHWHSAKELAAMVQQVIGVTRPAVTCPMWVARAAVPAATMYARMRGAEALVTTESLHALCANRHVLHEKATRELGYEPRPTLETVRDIYAWLDAAGLISRGATRGWRSSPPRRVALLGLSRMRPR